ncbi:MAG: copper chaperone PCu(A)C [Pontixanthobacter sp.]
MPNPSQSRTDRLSVVRRVCASAALGLSTIMIASCGDNSEPVEQAPDGAPGLAIENARLVLPAVGGNPGAVYFDLAYTGETNALLSAVSVAGAQETMMHQYGEEDLKVQMIPLDPVPLTNGSNIAFEPGGKHVMAMGLSDELAAGGSTQVTFILDNGDKTTVDAAILAAGDER